MQAKSWLGAHLLQQGNSDATRLIAEGRPSVVMCVNTGIPGEFGDDYDIAWIGRNGTDTFDPNNPAGDGYSTNAQQAAAQYVDRYLISEINGNQRIRYWAVTNEPVITSPDVMRWYAAFLAEAARILSTMGKCAVLANWSAGNPTDLALWQNYRDALNAVRLYGAVLGRHNYGPLDEYLGLRHRADQRVFTSMGYPLMPVAITECGADSVNSPNGPNQPWRYFYDGDVNQYYDYLMRLQQELRRDAAYCMGGAIFTYGQGWESHSLNDTGIGERLGNATSGYPLTPIPTRPSGTGTVTPPPPPAKPYTHKVYRCKVLNVRQFPWRANQPAPPVVGRLDAGRKVSVYKLDVGWASISPDERQWVNAYYLQRL